MLRAALSYGGARALNAILLLVSVPLVASYLSPSSIGLWITSSSLAALLSGVGDLGIGGHLITRAARSSTPSDAAGVLQASRAVMSLLLSLSYFLCAVGLLLVALDFASGGDLFKSGELRWSVLIVTGAFAIGNPLTIGERMLVGQQRADIAGVCRFIGAALSLIGVLGLVAIRAPMPLLLLAQLMGGVGGLVLIWIFARRHARDLMPSFKLAGRRSVAVALVTGRAYGALQIAGLAFLYLDVLLVAVLFGSSAVATYGYVQRFVFLAPLAGSLFAAPLWARVAKLTSGRLDSTLESALKRLTLAPWAVAGGSAAWAGVLALLAPRLHDALGGSFPDNENMVLAIGLWATVFGGWMLGSSLLNGFDQPRDQAIAMCCGLAISLAATPLLATSPTGVPLLLAAIYCAVVVLPGVIFIRRNLKLLGGASP